jgi:hypothetical protein
VDGKKIHNIIMEMGNKGRMKWSGKVRDEGTKLMISK